MKNKTIDVSNLKEINNSIADSNTKPTYIKSLSPNNNLLATLIACGTPPHSAFEQSIKKFDQHFHSKSESSKKSETTKYLNNNPHIIKAANEYKNIFIEQYTKTMHINKHLVISKIHELSEIATNNLDLKTALDCLKTIGSELGLFQKNLKIEHTHKKSDANIIELVQSNIPNK